jgi:signal transduction histidine kinase
LRERAEMTGGKFSLTSLNGAGAVAQITWPLEAQTCEGRVE